MEAFKRIPPVNDILQAPELAELRDILTQPFAGRLLDDILKEVRDQLGKNNSSAQRTELTTQIAKQLAHRLRQVLHPSLCRVINGTGVVLHTNLGRAPLPAAALTHLQEVSAAYSNLEFEVPTGKRGKRDIHVEGTLIQLLGCEAAIVVNNNAAAVLLVLNSLGEGGEVVVSRGEQVEIGGGFRIPEVMAKSGARLREVGTTNRTRVQDYEQAINEHTRLLLRVHPSNFRMIGFTERPTVGEFVALGRRHNVPTFEDLGSGCLAVMKSFTGEDEPAVSDSLRAGMDIVCFSGDKLLGGPQAGIIAGKKLIIDKIRQNPLRRALRVDKLTLSVLEVVLSKYLQGCIDDIPVWQMLRTSETELKQRAEAFARRAGALAKPVQMTSVAGGGSMPGSVSPSWGVALEVPGVTDVELEARLRKSVPPVITRIEEGRVLVDFRTVFRKDEDELLTILRQI